jgi:hypothetical protein
MSEYYPYPPTDVAVVQIAPDKADISWRADWQAIDNPSIGPKYHILVLYLSETAWNGDVLMQISLNGFNQFPLMQSVKTLHADKMATAFVFTGTWSKPPLVVTTCLNAAKSGANVRDMYLTAAAYDGYVLSGIAHHFVNKGEQYRFTPA